jgi:hypothetical protein
MSALGNEGPQARRGVGDCVGMRDAESVEALGARFLRERRLDRLGRGQKSRSA